MYISVGEVIDKLIKGRSSMPSMLYLERNIIIIINTTKDLVITDF